MFVVARPLAAMCTLMPPGGDGDHRAAGERNLPPGRDGYRWVYNYGLEYGAAASPRLRRLLGPLAGTGSIDAYLLARVATSKLTFRSYAEDDWSYAILCGARTSSDRFSRRTRAPLCPRVLRQHYPDRWTTGARQIATCSRAFMRDRCSVAMHNAGRRRRQDRCQAAAILRQPARRGRRPCSGAGPVPARRGMT